MRVSRIPAPAKPNEPAGDRSPMSSAEQSGQTKRNRRGILCGTNPSFQLQKRVLRTKRRYTEVPPTDKTAALSPAATDLSCNEIRWFHQSINR